MAKTFLLLPKAEQEIIDAWDWYEEQRIGLGDRFKYAVRTKIELILSEPLHYPKKGRYRQALTDTFRFLIVFKIVGDEIHIVSVFHTSRHPKRKLR